MRERISPGPTEPISLVVIRRAAHELDLMQLMGMNSEIIPIWHDNGIVVVIVSVKL